MILNCFPTNYRADDHIARVYVSTRRSLVVENQKKVMSNRYLKFPLNLSTVMDGNEFPAVDLVQSINSNLELIIVTRFGEHRCDPSFGCEIWDLDFELIVSARLWEEKLRHSLLDSVTSHEHRLTAVSLNVEITDVEKTNFIKKYTEIKKRVSIFIEGIIQRTGEPFYFRTTMFLSPLSLD